MNAIEEVINEYMQSDDAKAKIRKHLSECFESIIRDKISGYHSPLKKQIEEALVKALDFKSTAVCIPTYNQFICDLIEKQTRSATESAIEKQVATRVKELLTPAPEKIKLSELLELYREQLEEHHKSGCHCHDEARFGLKIDDNKSDNSCTVRLWETESDMEDKNYILKQSPDINIHIFRGKILSIRFKNDNVQNQLFKGPFFGFEKSLFQMFAAKTEIEVDVTEPDDVDRDYGEAD